jgi:hypothetical protein
VQAEKRSLNDSLSSAQTQVTRLFAEQREALGRINTLTTELDRERSERLSRERLSKSENAELNRQLQAAKLALSAANEKLSAASSAALMAVTNPSAAATLTLLPPPPHGSGALPPESGAAVSESAAPSDWAAERKRLLRSVSDLTASVADLTRKRALAKAEVMKVLAECETERTRYSQLETRHHSATLRWTERVLHLEQVLSSQLEAAGLPVPSFRVSAHSGDHKPDQKEEDDAQTAEGGTFVFAAQLSVRLASRSMLRVTD